MFLRSDKISTKQKSTGLEKTTLHLIKNGPKI